MENTGRSPIWPVLVYEDASAAIRFLVDAFGFEEAGVYRDENDENIVVHAELRWPAGGGVMLGSAGAGTPPFSDLSPGNSPVYIATDDPDALYGRAKAAGAAIAREMRDEDYGSRGFTVRDPEGNLWSFGTYAVGG